MKIEIEGSFEEVTKILSILQGDGTTKAYVAGEKIDWGQAVFIETNPKKKPVMTKPFEKKGWRSRMLDVFRGSVDPGFKLFGSYESVTAAAKAVWAPFSGCLTAHIDRDSIYKGEYKFVTRLDRIEEPIVPDPDDDDL